MSSNREKLLAAAGRLKPGDTISISYTNSFGVATTWGIVTSIDDVWINYYPVDAAPVTRLEGQKTYETHVSIVRKELPMVLYPREE